MVNQPHILVVDDDTRLRELLRRYLTENKFAVSVAANAAEARKLLAGLTFDLMVVDVMMPGEDGFSLTESVRRDSAVPILMLTARGEVEDRISGLDRGADDYLTKPFEPRELVLRISTILRRTTLAAQTARAERAVRLQLGDCVFDMDRGELWRNDELVHLTAIEESLLRTLALHAGGTVTRDDLIEQTAIEGGARTVDVQVTRLRRKIEQNPRMPRFLQTVRGRGYMLVPE